MEYNWDEINHLQLGKCGEYLVKMELIKNGFDIYSSEVDDRGIDFIVRTDSGNYYDIQVKSVRNLNYIFFQKSKFELKKNIFAAIVLFIENQPPQIYLIPSLEWQENPNALLVSKDYVGKKSPPEYGINLSQKNMNLLEAYRFDEQVNRLI